MHVADARRRPLMAWTGGEGTAAERRETVVAGGQIHVMERGRRLVSSFDGFVPRKYPTCSGA